MNAQPLTKFDNVLGILHIIEVMQSILQFFVATILFVVPFAFAIVFTFFPERIVSAYSKTTRGIVKERLNISDETIDKIPMFPIDAIFFKSRSEFIHRADEHPEEFSAMITALRIVGFIFCGMTAVAIFAIFVIATHPVTKP